MNNPSIKCIDFSNKAKHVAKGILLNTILPQNIAWSKGFGVMVQVYFVTSARLISMTSLKDTTRATHQNVTMIVA
jgi:hypothetical protein